MSQTDPHAPAPWILSPDKETYATRLARAYWTSLQLSPERRVLLPPEIRTRRLVLRRQDPRDASLIKDAVDASLTHLQASVAWAQTAPTPLPVLEAHLAASAAAFDAGEDWTFSILDQSRGRVLGGAALHRADAALSALVGSGTIETGYWLRADSTGYGYATEATASLIESAFTRLGAARVVVCHDPRNTASAGVPHRLGFRCLGIFTADVLPDRQAADGSIRPETKLWVLDAPAIRALDADV